MKNVIGISKYEQYKQITLNSLRAFLHASVNKEQIYNCFKLTLHSFVYNKTLPLAEICADVYILANQALGLISGSLDDVYHVPMHLCKSVSVKVHSDKHSVANWKACSANIYLLMPTLNTVRESELILELRDCYLIICCVLSIYTNTVFLKKRWVGIWHYHVVQSVCFTC